MRMLTTLLTLALAAAVGCGGTEVPPDQARPTPPPPVAHSAHNDSSVAVEWIDPEPETAQRLAEDVLDEPWNADKVTTLEPPRTGRLTMSITTLVGRTSNLEGFSTAVEAEAGSLEDRLADLGATQSDTEVTIRLPGSILFDFDSAAIRPDAERTLTEIVEVIADFPGRPVSIEGHTDAIASESYNQTLSEQRAKAVADWLAAHGVERNRLTVVGHGETEPVADNTTAEGRRQNRRVEIVIEK